MKKKYRETSGKQQTKRTETNSGTVSSYGVRLVRC